jgi:hypothetical protein
VIFFLIKSLESTIIKKHYILYIVQNVIILLNLYIVIFYQVTKFKDAYLEIL